MIIGVDFDNTIVRYDRIFHAAAAERSLIPADVPVSKTAVRDYLRSIGAEDDWTELQGYVYGARMNDALAFEGVFDFFERCFERGHEIHIISHKTKTPARGAAYDLHAAAAGWIETAGLIGSGRMARANVHFELSKEDKLSRIIGTGCTVFIDDLPEILTDPAFPRGVRKILFDPDGLVQSGEFEVVRSWLEVRDAL